MRRLAAVAAVAFLAAVGAGVASAGDSLTIYAVATKGQYANHADDRARGVLDNPFNADEDKPTGTGKKTRAGDNALIALKLYSDSSFKKQIGSGTYSCTFTTVKGGPLQRGLRAERRLDDRLGADQLRLHDLHPRGQRRHRKVPRCARAGLLGAARQGAPAHVRLAAPPPGLYGFGTSLRSPFESA